MDKRNTMLHNISEKQATEYLIERSKNVTQKTLDRDRQSIQIIFGRRLQRIKSEKEATLSKQSRAYRPDQIKSIIQQQNSRNGLATAISYSAGLRAHELLTIRPVSEQESSSHRQWSNERFTGRNGVTYTVVGKGGLIREIQLPQSLSDRLEERRLTEPKSIIDRGIYYEQVYEISGGKTWSTNFNEKSVEVLEWSNGAHGLRHSYAQERVNEVQERGKTYSKTLEIVSQELGHFRPEITEVYLR
jgi:integrase